MKAGFNKELKTQYKLTDKVPFLLMSFDIESFGPKRILSGLRKLQNRVGLPKRLFPKFRACKTFFMLVLTFILILHTVFKHINIYCMHTLLLVHGKIIAVLLCFHLQSHHSRT